MANEDYDKKIKEEQDKLKKYEYASYDSKKRGYVVDGEVYTKTQLNALIAKSNKAIKDYQSGKKSDATAKFKAFDAATSRGAEYSKLVKIATDIKVKDYASAIDNLRAWRNVQTFVENNGAIKAVEIEQKNPSVFEISTAWLRNGTGPKYVKTIKDVDPKNLQKNINYAADLANTFAEKDTTGPGGQYQVVERGKTLLKNRTVVTDEPTLTARQAEINSIMAAQEPDTNVATAARKGTTPKYTITLQPSAVAAANQPASAAQFRMAEEAGKTTVVSSKKNKNQKLNKPGNSTTTGAGTGTGSTVVVDGKKVKVGSEQWKEIIQKEFGSMWDVYNSNPDVKSVIDKSVKEGWFNDETKLTASLQNTGWYRTTQQSARQFAVQQSTDPANVEAKINSNVESIRAESIAQGFTLNDATLRKLATDQLKFGWSDQQRFNAIGSEVVAQSQLGGGQGMADLRQSSVARDLRSKAAAYFQKPSEDMISTWTQQILTGQKSNVQWDELMRSSARTQFRSLQPALDRGEDVDTAMYAYKQQAQATLGSSIDASQIDWTQDKWNKALNYRDEKTGEYRQMDLWEWNKYLRTLPEWQNTDEAKNVYGNLVQSLARGFGKTA